MSGEEEEPSPAEAFAALQGEVAHVRRAMEALGPILEKAVRGADYTSTLGAMDRSIRALNDRHDAIEKHPALQMTPQAWAASTERAAAESRRAASQDHQQAETAFNQATYRLQGIVHQARTAEAQSALLYRVGGGVFLAGVVFWAIVAGPLARLLPAGWHVPEKMAAATLHENRWTAGSEIMQSANPAGWTAMVADLDLVKANKDAIAQCRDEPKRRGSVRCTILVPAQGDGFGRLQGH